MSSAFYHIENFKQLLYKNSDFDLRDTRVIPTLLSHSSRSTGEHFTIASTREIKDIRQFARDFIDDQPELSEHLAYGLPTNHRFYGLLPTTTKLKDLLNYIGNFTIVDPYWVKSFKSVADHFEQFSHGLRFYSTDKLSGAIGLTHFTKPSQDLLSGSFILGGEDLDESVCPALFEKYRKEHEAAHDPNSSKKPKSILLHITGFSTTRVDPIMGEIKDYVLIIKDPFSNLNDIIGQLAHNKYKYDLLKGFRLYTGDAKFLSYLKRSVSYRQDEAFEIYNLFKMLAKNKTGIDYTYFKPVKFIPKCIGCTDVFQQIKQLTATKLITADEYGLDRYKLGLQLVCISTNAFKKVKTFASTQVKDTAEGFSHFQRVNYCITESNASLPDNFSILSTIDPVFDKAVFNHIDQYLIPEIAVLQYDYPGITIITKCTYPKEDLAQDLFSMIQEESNRTVPEGEGAKLDYNESRLFNNSIILVSDKLANLGTRNKNLFDVCKDLFTKRSTFHPKVRTIGGLIFHSEEPMKLNSKSCRSDPATNSDHFILLIKDPHITTEAVRDHIGPHLNDLSSFSYTWQNYSSLFVDLPEFHDINHDYGFDKIREGVEQTKGLSNGSLESAEPLVAKIVINEAVHENEAHCVPEKSVRTKNFAAQVAAEVVSEKTFNTNSHDGETQDDEDDEGQKHEDDQDEEYEDEDSTDDGDLDQLPGKNSFKSFAEHAAQELKSEKTFNTSSHDAETLGGEDQDDDQSRNFHIPHSATSKVFNQHSAATLKPDDATLVAEDIY